MEGNIVSPDIRQHVLSRLAAAPVEHDPYPHIRLNDFFPAQFYRRIVDRMPPLEAYRNMLDTNRTGRGGSHDPYAHRYTLNQMELPQTDIDPEQKSFWNGIFELLRGKEFVAGLLGVYEPYLRQRFGERLPKVGFVADIQLVRDFAGYALGPHTDAPQKVVVLLIYLPALADHPELGTSIYTPLDAGFRCDGGPHYPHGHFTRVATMDYIPNSGLCFLKSGISFHGVEPVSEPGVQRDLIQLSVLHKVHA